MNKRHLLNAILQGEATPHQVREELTGGTLKTPDRHLLNQAEQDILFALESRMGNDRQAFRELNDRDLLRLILIKRKVTADVGGHHHLQQVDIAALDEKELNQTFDLIKAGLTETGE